MCKNKSDPWRHQSKWPEGSTTNVPITVTTGPQKSCVFFIMCQSCLDGRIYSKWYKWIAMLHCMFCWDILGLRQFVEQDSPTLYLMAVVPTLQKCSQILAMGCDKELIVSRWPQSFLDPYLIEHVWDSQRPRNPQDSELPPPTSWFQIPQDTPRILGSMRQHFIIVLVTREEPSHYKSGGFRVVAYQCWIVRNDWNWVILLARPGQARPGQEWGSQKSFSYLPST